MKNLFLISIAIFLASCSPKNCYYEQVDVVSQDYSEQWLGQYRLVFDDTRMFLVNDSDEEDVLIFYKVGRPALFTSTMIYQIESGGLYYIEYDQYELALIPKEDSNLATIYLTHKVCEDNNL